MSLKRAFYLPYTGWRWLRYQVGDRRPLCASLKLTTRCTLRCRHCPWTEGDVPELTTRQWVDIIDALARRGAMHLTLEGGEPTLRPDLVDLVAAGQRRGMKVTIATNGTRSLEAYRPDRYLVSVDGLEDVHDQLRGPGAFRRLLENLPTARAPRIALVSLSKQNQHQIRSILDFYVERLDGFWFSFVYDYQGEERLELDRVEKLAAARLLLELMPHYPIVNTRSFLSGVGENRACRPWLLVMVTADGQEHGDCVISARERPVCERCDLPCHREISDFLEPRFLVDQLRVLRRKPWLRSSKAAARPGG